MRRFPARICRKSTREKGPVRKRGRRSVCFIISPAPEKDKRKNSGIAAIFPVKILPFLSFLTRDLKYFQKVYNLDKFSPSFSGSGAFSAAGAAAASCSSRVLMVGERAADIVHGRFRRGGRVLQRVGPAADLRFRVDGRARRGGLPAWGPGDGHGPGRPAGRRGPAPAVLTICHDSGSLLPRPSRRGIFCGWRCRPGCAAGPYSRPALP